VSPIAGPVESHIRALLAEERSTWAAEQPVLAELFDGLDAFVAAGGKRLRPAFCYWGAVAAGATGSEPGCSTRAPRSCCSMPSR
jgi:geranylgeranyl diphosphate synthase type I